MDEATLSALIIGPSGHGKSWLGSTTPPPRLILDLEGRAHWTPNGKGATFWDGISDPMKLPRSSTRTYIVRVMELSTLARVRQWLRSGAHPFRSVTMDSLMEAQMRAQSSIRPGIQALRELDWGTLLRTMEQEVREVRDLLLIPETRVRVAVFIAGAKKDVDAGFIRPLMQGQITLRVPYWMDLVAYLEKVSAKGGTEGVTRQLWIEQRPQNDLEVKDGTDAILQAFGPCIASPDFTAMYEALQAERNGAVAARAAEGGS